MGKQAAEADPGVWPPAVEDLTPVPGGKPDRKIHLPVHVGEWPTEFDPAQQSRHRHMHRNPEEPLPGEVIQSAAQDVKQDAEILKHVPEGARIDGPSGLASVLQSGRFEVDGYVSFNPLQPFNSSPDIPEGTPETSDRMLAWSQIRYEH